MPVPPPDPSKSGTPVPGETDVVIAGAGPAGVLTAVLLTRRGHRVILLGDDRVAPQIEGLGTRVVEALTAQSLNRAAEAVGPAVQRLARWGGNTAGHNREFVTARQAFNTALRRDAAAAGVDCRTVRRLARQTDRTGVTVETLTPAGETRAIRAAFFIEARGRAAPRIRTGSQRGPETTALTRRLVANRPEPATAVETFPEGWSWYVSDGETALLQIFVDSQAGLPKRSALAAHFDNLAATLTLIPELVGNVRTAGAVLARNATTLLSGRLVELRCLRVGDAALALDPLSGHGLFEALGSALSAAATVHTILTLPERRDLAEAFYRQRAELGFWRNARIGRDFYRLETAWAERPFWAARRDWPDDRPAHPRPDREPARIAAMPVIEDGAIAERRVVVTADQPRGVWVVDNVPLADLLDDPLSRQGAGEPALSALAARFAVRPTQVRAALRYLDDAGLLPP